MENQLSITKKIDNVVLSVIGQKNLKGFEKAHTVSNAIVELEKLLDSNYMKPIMALQGTTLGFKTDKDLKKNPSGYGYVKGDGYAVEVVRRCLIEAVLKGYQPTNNEFNIIGGNMYPAKAGLQRKTNEWEGLKKSIIHTIKSFQVDKGSALVESSIKWELNGEKFEEIVPIPLKVDQYTSVDAMLGKAERKALAWLLSNISGEPVVDGEIEDVGHIVVDESKKIDSKPEITQQQLNDAVIEIKQGRSTLDDIVTLFTLTSEQHQLLIDSVLS